MTQLARSNFQDHPFHLVSPSPWPLYTSISLFSLATSGALSMHAFNGTYNIFYFALTIVVFSMSFWFRDIITEGTGALRLMPDIFNFFYLNTAKALPIEDVKQALSTYNSNLHLNPRGESFLYKKDKNSLGYYLAGLLEGDGSISIPGLGTTTMNRILNPRIVFTTHVNNVGMYVFLQSELGGIGRFQTSGTNTLRYIIGDKEGILLCINLMHGKLRTPKNKRFNDLIKSFNLKYSLNIAESLLDTSDFGDNSWLTGFTEADGHFGIKYVESKPKSDTRKRSVSESVSLKFRLDQRAYDKPTSSDMLPFIVNLASFLRCNVKSYNSNKSHSEVLSLSVTSIENTKLLINYFEKYPLLGEKWYNYNKWSTVYYMIISKEHLTKKGRLEIRSLIGLDAKPEAEPQATQV
jgi:hypothetical protein